MTPSTRDGFQRPQADGIIPELVRENLTLAALPAPTQWGIVSRKRQGELVDRFMQRLGIKAAGAEQKIHELGRQSAEGPSGAMAVQEYETFSSTSRPRYRRYAKGEIQRLIAELAEQGARGSHDFIVEELVEGSQRVVVPE